MITKLTKKQESKIKIYQKKWYDKFHSLEFDEKKATDFVDVLYSILCKPKPIKIILDSPLACQLAINILKLNDVSQLDSQLRSQLDSQLRSQLDSQLDSQLRSQLRSQQLKYFGLDYWGDTSWYGYLCFYEYIHDELFPKIEIKLFEDYLKLADANIVALTTFDGIAFISKPPKFINFDSNNRLHSKHDYAVYFNDGWGLHYVNGIFFGKELFQKAFKDRTITSEEILSLENAEQRACLINEYGFEYIFGNLKDKQEVDRQKRTFNKTKKEVEYVLFVSEIGNYKAHILKVEWYEKDRKRQTVLGVPNNINDAIEAVAWTCYTTKENWEKNLVMEA